MRTALQKRERRSKYSQISNFILRNFPETASFWLYGQRLLKTCNVLINISLMNISWLMKWVYLSVISQPKIKIMQTHIRGLSRWRMLELRSEIWVTDNRTIFQSNGIYYNDLMLKYIGRLDEIVFHANGYSNNKNVFVNDFDLRQTCSD